MIKKIVYVYIIFLSFDYLKFINHIKVKIKNKFANKINMNSYNPTGFVLTKSFDNHKEFNEYLTQNLTFATEKSSLINCSICKAKNHKMRYKIGRCNDKTCNSGDIPCARQIKILQ